MNNASDHTLITYAKDYIRAGFVVMPVINTLVDGKTQKKPIIERWQTLTLNDTDSILRAFNNPRVNAIGLLTGSVNGVFVLDVDPGADLTGKEVPPTVCVKTGRGMHYYFKNEEGLGNTVNGDTNFDTRGEGGFVVVPPSWHHLGEYSWVIDLNKDMLAPLPDWVKALCKIDKQSYSQFVFGARAGGRNNSAAKIIGHVLAHLHEGLWEDFGWTGAKAWNRRNEPPLDEDELYKVFISIAKREKLRRDSYKK